MHTELTHATLDRPGIAPGLLDQLGAAAFTVDAAGAITAWNPAAERLYQWRPFEVVGRCFAEVLLPPAHVHQLVAAELLTTTLERGDWWEGQLAMRRKDGTYLLARCSLAARRDTAGRVCGLIVTATDITALELAQEQLREENLGLRRQAQSLLRQLRILRQERLAGLPRLPLDGARSSGAEAEGTPRLQSLGTYLFGRQGGWLR